MCPSSSPLSADQLLRPTQYGYRRSVVTNWCQLIPGEAVVLTGPGSAERYEGRVDAVSDDGAILWLVLDNGCGRRLFHRTDGHTALLDPSSSTTNR